MEQQVTYELFHRIAEPASARVRRYVIDYGLEDRIRFRNVAYPEAESDLRARGTGETPALWDGVQLTFGAEAVIALLARLTNIGRSP